MSGSNVLKKSVKSDCSLGYVTNVIVRYWDVTETNVH